MRILTVGRCVALACSIVFAVGAVDAAVFKTPPVWDLAKDAGDISVRFRENGGRIPLGEDSSFEIPCAVIRDYSTFTATATLKFNDLSEPSQIGLFSQISSNVGWAFHIMNYGRIGSPLTLTVDGVDFNTGWFRCKPGATHTFTVAAKRGLVVTYMDDKVLKRCFTTVTPASVPIRVGGKTVGWRGKRPGMKGVELLDLKIYGPEEEFFAKGESREFATGCKGGKGWMVTVPTVETNDLPRLLFYGDSISSGYSPFLNRLLKDKAYLYHWRNFVSTFSINEKAFNDVATLAKYDMIVFNNGLHSLKWTPENATDAQIAGVMRAMVRAFRKGAPQAKLVWLSTTPRTAKKGADGKVSATGELDYVVRRINRIAAEVMAEEKVDVIDGYGLLIGHLDLAAGDQSHWKPAAYEILANAIAEKFQTLIKK